MSEIPGLPKAGIDFPATLQAFDDWFSTEEKCLAFIRKLRWPKAFQCPACNHTEGWHLSNGLIRCSNCLQDISILNGTIFHKTRKPLKVWFQAMWYITSQKSGGSALGLKRILGLGSYQTAWTWLHKMRHAMVRPDRDMLKGTVEVDETMIGGESHGGKRGRGAENKHIVVIAIEIIDPIGFGRVRMKRIETADSDNLISFIKSNVSAGSQIRTDAWRGYSSVAANDYVHEAINISASGDPAHVTMPGVHRVASLLKRWLLGTHQGSVSSQHLEYFLDEYTFRFNRRHSKSRGMLFYRLMQQAVQIKAVTYRELASKALET
jgi:transposase-like protein